MSKLENGGFGQIVRFLSSGLANSLVGFAVVFLLMATGAPPLLANVGGFIVGLALSFILSRRYVFRGAGTLHGEAGRFLVAFGIAFATNLATLAMLLHYLDVQPVAAQLVSVGTYTIVMFTLSRWFVFQPPPTSKP